MNAAALVALVAVVAACHAEKREDKRGAGVPAPVSAAPSGPGPAAPEDPGSAPPPAEIPFSTVLPASYAEPPAPAAAGSSSFCAGATVDDPEVSAPLAAFLKASGLSPQYLDQCAGCHGANGDGRDAAPHLTTARLSPADFAAVVRTGRGDMPAFPAAALDDATLAADTAALRGGRAAGASLPEGFHDAPLPALTAIDAAAYQTAMAAGLTVWRKPGATGACAACHGPDGLDLARIGYSTASILRRGIGQGRTPDEARAVAAMIAAQRRRFHIDKPCSPTLFRPLQPGGKPLPAAAGDAALERQLVARGLDLAAPPPEDAAAARALADRILALNPGDVAVAFPLNPWTADGVNGAALRSEAEWIPELAVEPRTPEAAEKWTAAQNRYLEAPTDEAFWALYDLVQDQDAARFGDAAGSVGERLSREKYRAALLLQHMARRDARTLPDLRAAANFLRFPVWEAAQVASVMTRGCGEDGTGTGTPFPCWGFLPRFFAKMGTDRDALTRDAQAQVLPWLTAGLLLDPALQFTENGGAQMQHWHAAFRDALGEALPFHQVYFGALHLVKATDGLDATLPSGQGFAETTVNGCWGAAGAGLSQWTGATLKALAAQPPEPRTLAALTTVNRMALLLVEAAVKAPAPGCKTAAKERLAALVKALGTGKNSELAARVADALR